MRVSPRASRSEVGGWRDDGTLTVRVTAPPVEGRANAAVGAVLAAALGVPASAVRVAHGGRSRDKLVRVAGLSPADIRKKLGGDT